MRSLFFFLFIFQLASNIQAQNLVVNADFEEVNICQTYKEECSPKGWRPISLKQFGYLNSEEKGRYISLLLYSLGRKNDRKFAQTELLFPLEEGREYTIQFKVKPDQFWIKEVGVAFSNELILKNKIDIKNLPQQRLTMKLPQEVEEGKWILLEEKFIAGKADRFLIIGNFLEDALTHSRPIDKKKYKKHLKQYLPAKRIKYGIDEVQLFCTDTTFVYENIAQRAKAICQDSIRHLLEKINPKELEETFADEIREKETIIVSKTKTSNEIPNKITIDDLEFEFNQSDILSMDHPKLDQVIFLLKKNKDLKVRITGHTDAVGDENYNLLLSKKRAESTKQYLLDKAITKDRIFTVGKGESIPLMDNQTEFGKSKNRRVEITFFK